MRGRKLHQLSGGKKVANHQMKIGELADRTGMTASRIRYYEQVGLLQPVTRMPNGYRVYPPAAVETLQLIAIGQKAGFTLDEMRALLPTNGSKWDHDQIFEIIDRKIAEVEAQEALLAKNKVLLLAIKQGLSARPEGQDCNSNTQRLVSLILQK
ncbi:transcriptional regulator, MerR family [Ruegeria sp. TrichCH4B]|nr:transcriptional regulator, MerR family [Ruegeria sp. TrichCH4B]